MISKPKSLTFYQKTSLQPRQLNMSNVNVGVITSGIQASSTFLTINTTNDFNRQFNSIFSKLNNEKQMLQVQINDRMKNNTLAPDKRLRDAGVRLAWEYEKGELDMGGTGTRKWSRIQKEELQTSKSGTVRTFKGHHINNVKHHPELQANPDNIKILSDEEHKKVHKQEGGTRNSTEGKLIDKNKRLVDTNKRRLFKNELKGIGAALAIGLGVGFTLGFIVSLAQSGISPENIKNAAVIGVKTSTESMFLAGINHLIIRNVGEIVTKSMQGVVNNLGVSITENIGKMCQMASVGLLAIAVFSAYQFTKLKMQGYSTKECLLRVGKQASFSLAVLAISLIAQAIFGGPAGTFVMLSIGIVMITYSIVQNVHSKKLSNEINCFMVKKCEPCF